MALNAPLLQAFSNLTPTSFTAQWTSVPEARDYVLYVAKTLTETENDDGIVISTLSNFHPGYNGRTVSGLRWEVTNLLPATTYYVRVDARAGTQISPPYPPKSISTQELPVRKTARGLRVDSAFSEIFLARGGFSALMNLLTGVSLRDGINSPDSLVSPYDVYAVSQTALSDIPKSSSYLTLAILSRIKNFRGKVSGVLEQLKSSFKSFAEKSNSGIAKATPNFKSPYGMYGQVYAAEFFLKDKTGAEAVRVGEDSEGYWKTRPYSSIDTEKVVAPRPPFDGDPTYPTQEPPDVYVDFLRVGSRFNIAVPASGIGGLKPRVPAAVNSDTGAMLILRSVSEPGRLFFVKTERLN
jgi:hypothetical protein